MFLCEQFLMIIAEPFFPKGECKLKIQLNETSRLEYMYTQSFLICGYRLGDTDSTVCTVDIKAHNELSENALSLCSR